MTRGGRTLAFLLAASFLSVVCVTAQRCQTPRNTRGNCISLPECEPLFNIFKMRAIDQKTKEYLQKSQCGYDRNVPKVCCDINSVACKTPLNQPGLCIPLTSCKSLVDLLSGNELLSDDVINYVRQSACGRMENREVCCPLIEKDIRQEIKPIPNLLPDESECGYQGIQRKIKGGNLTDIYEYPWMALLEYETVDGVELSCAGTLINSKYILTAAHCTSGLSSRSGKLVRVRLAEYDTKNETDCMVTAAGVDCVDSIVQVNIESVVNHENYNKRDRKNDIALIRLQETVAYTDFVRPICLPKTPLTLPQNLIVAGWGATETGPTSDVKLQLRVPVFDKTQCISTFRRAGLTITDDQICAGGEFGKDSCSGDSGGPLMTSVKSADGFYWYQVGIVSFGPTPCAQDGIPAVYTAVWQYYDWIVSKLRP